MEQVMEVIKWIFENSVTVMAILGALVTAASLFVGLTATPRDDEVVGIIRSVLERVSLVLNTEGRGEKKLLDEDE